MTVIGEAFVAIRPQDAGFGAEADKIVSGGLGPVAKNAAKIVGGIFVGHEAVAFAKEGVARLEDIQKSALITEARVKATGGAAGESAEDIEKLAKAQQDLTGTDRELIVQGENILLGFHNIKATGGIFDRTTKDANDLAVALGQDVPTAARNLGRALEDPTKAARGLRAENILLSASEQQQIKDMSASGDTLGAQELILKKVEGAVGGTAEAYGKSLPGQVARAKVSMEDMKAELTAGAAPALSIVADAAVKVEGAISSLPGPLRTVTSVVLGGGVAYVSLARPLLAAVDLFQKLKPAQEAATAATLETSAANEAEAATAAEAAVAQEAQSISLTQAQIASLRKVASNEMLVFSDAEVATAMEARTVAEYQALVSNEALIAGDEALSVAQLEAAATADALAGSEVAAEAASLGMVGVLGLAAVGAGIAVGVFSALSDAFSSNVQGTDDYTTALEKNTGTLQENVDAVTADKLAHSEAANTAKDAGISFVDMFRAVREGTDDWGGYSRAIARVQTDERAGIDSKKALADALRGAGAGSTEFGKTLIAEAESGKLNAKQVGALVDQLEGLHNGYTQATGAAKESAEAHKAVAEASKGEGDAIAYTQQQMDEAQKAVDGFAQLENDLAAAMDRSYQATIAAQEGTLSYDTAANNLVDTIKKEGFSLDITTTSHGKYNEHALKDVAAIDATGQAIEKAIVARYNETHSVEDAINTGAMYTAGLHNQLLEAGYTEDQIAAMIATMHLTPDDIKTTFSNNAIEQQIVVQKYISLLSDIDPDVQTMIETEINQGQLDLVNSQLADIAKGVHVPLFLDPVQKDFTVTSNGTSRTVQVRASGGPVYAGQMYQVNEHGKEFFAPAVDGTILSAGATERALSTGAPGASSSRGGPLVHIENATFGSSGALADLDWWAATKLAGN